jgi:glycerate 2-kinase
MTQESFLTHSIRRLPESDPITAVLQAAMQAVDPIRAVQNALSLSGDHLTAAGRVYDLRQYERLIVIGFGKASAAMAIGIDMILPGRITQGAVIAKHLPAPQEISRIHPVQVLPGDHPVPGENSIASTRQLLKYLKDTTRRDLVICLISGGGSALFTMPHEGIRLEDMQELTKLLLASGAEIGEINTLRKHLDQVKGGGLARLAAPADMITLILSDVIGSPLDVIASGPTVADTSTYGDALDILAKYRLVNKTPPSIMRVLQLGASGQLPETLKINDPVLNQIQNTVIADNSQAARAAVEQARSSGWNALLLTTYLRGEASQAGMMLAAILRQVVDSGDPISRPACIVAGGETTVTLRGDGLGGRNLELALGAVQELAGLERVLLVTLATDGDDGPTHAAGAVVSGETFERGKAAGLSPAAHLLRNDSYPYFAALDDVLITGPSGTNVNDLVFLFALPQP